MDLAEFIEKELESVPDRDAVYTNGWVWIRCPWHSEGNERTGSYRISMSDNNRFPVGSCKCYGCGRVENWNDLAAKLGLHKADEKYDTGFSRVRIPSTWNDNEEEDDGVLEHERHHAQNLVVLEPWDSKKRWRSIPGHIVNKIGGICVYNNKYNRMYVRLPCLVYEEDVGYIDANIEKSSYGANYFNKPGPWSEKSGLFPFDYVKKMLVSRKIRSIALVEGPRDALRCIAYGIPALSTLGASSWSLSKRDLVVSLPIDSVFSCHDGDEPGRVAARKVYETFKGEMPYYRIKFREQDDPGNAHPLKMASIKLTMGIYSH